MSLASRQHRFPSPALHVRDFSAHSQNASQFSPTVKSAFRAPPSRVVKQHNTGVPFDPRPPLTAELAKIAALSKVNPRYVSQQLSRLLNNCVKRVASATKDEDVLVRKSVALDSMQVWHSMRSAQVQPPSLEDTVTVLRLTTDVSLPVLSNVKQLEQYVETHFSPNQEYFSMLLVAYSKLESLDNVLAVFQRVHDRRIKLPFETFRAMMYAFGQRGHLHGAGLVFQELVKFGYSGDADIFLGFISAFVNTTAPERSPEVSKERERRIREEGCIALRCERQGAVPNTFFFRCLRGAAAISHLSTTSRRTRV